jgi:hypothetical protein
VTPITAGRGAQNQLCISMRKVEEAFIRRLGSCVQQEEAADGDKCRARGILDVGMEMSSAGGGLIGFSLQT